MVVLVLINLLRADSQSEREMKISWTDAIEAPMMDHDASYWSLWLTVESHSRSDTWGDGELHQPAHYGGKKPSMCVTLS